MSKLPDFFKRLGSRYSFHANPWRRMPVSEQPLRASAESLAASGKKLEYLQQMLEEVRKDFPVLPEHAVAEAIQVHDALGVLLSKLARTQTELAQWLDLR